MKKLTIQIHYFAQSNLEHRLVVQVVFETTEPRLAHAHINQAASGNENVGFFYHT